MVGVVDVVVAIPKGERERVHKCGVAPCSSFFLLMLSLVFSVGSDVGGFVGVVVSDKSERGGATNTLQGRPRSQVVCLSIHFCLAISLFVFNLFVWVLADCCLGLMAACVSFTLVVLL